MSLIRRKLFESDLLSIGHVVCRPATASRGELEQASANVMVLPLAGVFARHDGPRSTIIANPSHAMFIGRARSYRISYPGAIGDDCLTLAFPQAAIASLLGDAMALEDFNASCLDSLTLLSPASLLGRSLLKRRLLHGQAGTLEIEELSLSLLADAVRAACRDDWRSQRAHQRSTGARRRRQIETVKEAVSVYPEQKWSLSRLARLANTSPYHLARMFRAEVGAPLHQYLLRTRLARALEAVLDANADLTRIAHDHGFASHSHFTASFRALFGFTPTDLRHRSPALRASQLRKILTAAAVAAP